jgi:hypothetical protein
MMTVGEYDFGDSFLHSKIRFSSVFITDSTNFVTYYIFPIFVQLVMVGMVFVGTIIIANLITGLTIYNIDQLYREASAFQLSQSAKQIGSAENIVVTSRAFKWAKKMLPSLLGKTSLFEKLSDETGNYNFKVCVKPNENNIYDGDAMKLTSVQNFEVFSYSQNSKTAGASLKMSIPSWILKHTFEALAEKEKLESGLVESLTKKKAGRTMIHSTSSDDDTVYSK